MPIRIGANPIGWSNDDMLEIGGETPLETCLAEAKRGRLRGHGARQQVSARAGGAEGGAGAVRHGLRLRLVFGRPAEARRRCRDDGSCAPHLDLLKAMGSKVFIFAETSNAIHGDSAKPLSQRPVMQGRRMGRVRPPHDRVRRAHRCEEGAARSSTTTTWAPSCRARRTSTR